MTLRESHRRYRSALRREEERLAAGAPVGRNEPTSPQRRFLVWWAALFLIPVSANYEEVLGMSSDPRSIWSSGVQTWAPWGLILSAAWAWVLRPLDRSGAVNAGALWRELAPQYAWRYAAAVLVSSVAIAAYPLTPKFEVAQWLGQSFLVAAVLLIPATAILACEFLPGRQIGRSRQASS